MAVESPAAVAVRPGLSRRRADRGRFRTAAAVLFLPAVVFSLYVSARDTFPSNYTLGEAASANNTVVVLAPYLAVSAAWEMATVRTLWGHFVLHRPVGQLIAARLAPVAGGGIAAFVLTYGFLVGAAMVTDFPGWSLLILSLVSVATWTLFGAALALLVRQLVALPASLIVPFLLIGLPGAWQPLWIRHLNGFFLDCCGTDTVLDPRALHASIAALALIILLSAGVIWVRTTTDGRRAAGRLAVLVPALGFAAAAAVLVIRPVTALGAEPTRDRPASDLVCAHDVCLWPEDRGVRAVNEDTYAAIKAAWRRLGLDPPAERAGPIDTRDTLALTTRSAVPADALLSMAQQYPRAVAGCRSYDDPGRNALLDGIAYRLYLTAGGGDPAARSQFLLPGEPPLTPGQVAGAWADIGSC